jgi:hypothetical protein
MILEITLRRDEEPPLECVAGRSACTAADKDLAVRGLAPADVLGLREAGIVGRHRAPAEQDLTLVGYDPLDYRLEVGAPRLVSGHEDIGHPVVARLGQRETQVAHSARRNSCGIWTSMPAPSPTSGIGADCAAMRQVLQDLQAMGDDLVRLAAVQVGDEADAAGIMIQARIVEAGTTERALLARGGRWRVWRRHGLAPRCAPSPLLP